MAMLFIQRWEKLAWLYSVPLHPLTYAFLFPRKHSPYIFCNTLPQSQSLFCMECPQVSDSEVKICMLKFIKNFP